MKLRSAEVRLIDLELLEAMDTAAERHHDRPLVLVHVETDVGEGDGECEALATTRYSGESAETVEALLVDRMIPTLLSFDGESRSALDLLAHARGTAGGSMAKAALEMALLDAELRATEQSLASFIGARRSSIPAGATIGIGPADSVVSAARSAVAAGFSRLKLKISPGNDLGPLEAIRRALPDVVLVADANGSYSLGRAEDRKTLSAIDALGLSYIEQPLAPTDFAGHAELRAEFSTSVLLDESIASNEDLERAIELGACSGVSVKPARLGGIAAARKVHDRCQAAGLSLAIGGLFEAGLGRAASIAVGALDGFNLPGDLGPSSRYFAEDIVGGLELVDGMLAVPSGPGLGVEIRRDVVEKLTARLHVLRPT